MTKSYNPLTVEGRMAILRRDKIYPELFCYNYQTEIIDFFPNNEVFPPRGLIYLFDNQLGGFSIDGIKNSLEQIILERR